MSGFEIAGVVLGSIPLIVNALQNYGEGVAVMKNMKDYEMVFSDIHTSFAASVGIYTDSCYQLLSPLNLPDRQMNELLEGRQIDAWSNSELKEALEIRLGSNCKVYLSLMDKLNRRIVMFCKKLRLNDDLKPPWIVPDGSTDEKARKKFFKNSWTRIRGGFDSDKYATLLQDIDRDIDKISKLTSGAAQLEPLRAEKKNKIQSTYWLNIRDQAQRLFESLSSRFCPCSCKQPHKANLRLDVRRNHNTENEAVRFAFLFTFEKSGCVPKALPWDWRDVEIEASQCLSTQPPTAPSPAYAAGGTKKTARFAPSITVSPTQPNSRSPSPSLASKIDNLCKALMNGYQSGCCLGFLEDQPWQHHIYSVSGPDTGNQICEAASLKELICSPKSLATRQKCTLALTLASAVLQLHDTPWLPRSWDTKDIFILKSRTGATISSHFYVSRTFDSSASSQAASKRRRCVKNEMIFALGVALLELTHGCPLLSLKEPEDLNEFGQEDIMTEVSIATRLADEINDLESENYAKAVLRCVRCNFDTFTYDFEDREFREKFYEGVVVPLQLDYEYATGRKI
ncbi:uncharacterized protein BDR25DRAFT_307145 [Lindgomyces ingoldianus]|uniref:Uncharacterized protein n=1 Tax=Lindgomyces ingoldianus TaxID=673940 RepID=A0ACB6QER6_9PLEO|nr:uncharacterized protein BDR25DRAFT_307145 [Lindgomyces ingoldianus]KAF2464631.1 hypothetical protein BDR25DRAFT_307145 [Lindgomyces ingoldianus]